MGAYADQPEIMAIGDSMYQGVHSLSVAPWMVQHSPPALVARAMGRPMTLPDLKQPLLWDLEQEVRDGGLADMLRNIRAHCSANLQHWRPEVPWSDHEAFDNVAIGGASIASLWEDTDEKYFEQFKTLAATIQNGSPSNSDVLRTLPALWFALSSCYTLNPRHRQEQTRSSQLQQAIDRAPRILLINIGSNDGLFEACFLGDVGPTAQARAQGMLSQVRDLAERLKALPPRVDTIVFNGLIQPRFVPNLMPSGAEENEFPGEDYYSVYGPRLTATHLSVGGTELRAYDALIADVNAESRAILEAALGSRLHFADLYAICPPLDGKHFRRRGLAIPGRRITLDNRPLTALIGGYHGGFASLDNMHPTVVGYAVIADAVLAAVGATQRTDKQAAFDADELLRDFPGWRVLQFQVQTPLILSIARLFFGFGKDATAV
ncbi:MAG: SGNH/GDSL hydrolase family protein [Acetobacteraceae bacterium]